MSGKTKKSNNSKKISKIIPLTLGALIMMMFGAAATCAVTKIISPTEIKIPANSVVTMKQPVQTEQQAKKATVIASSLPASIEPAPAIENVPADSEMNSAPESVLAKIIAVKPLYTTKVVSYRSCKMVPRPVLVQNQRAIDGSGVLVGGVTGGLLGHQIGKGNGNVIATVGGAIVGSLVGNNMEREMNRPDVQYVYVKVCQTHHTEKSVIKGYNVTYSYDGKQSTKFMKNKPQSDYLRLELAPVVS